jgi:DNA-binding PadR family transcriptional regulator
MPRRVHPLSSKSAAGAATHQAPFPPATFHILLSLARSERHGYGIMSDVAESTDGAMRIGPGTLYGTIKRLLAAGLIEESDERQDPALDDERRRYYRITAAGREALENEARRLAACLQIARASGLVISPEKSLA